MIVTTYSVLLDYLPDDGDADNDFETAQEEFEKWLCDMKAPVEHFTGGAACAPYVQCTCSTMEEAVATEQALLAKMVECGLKPYLGEEK